MKAYTSRERFDEARRFTGVRERMGQVRLDSEANEQVVLSRTDARRRSGDVAEGSPDDGFLVTDAHLLDPIKSTEGWQVVGLAVDDERRIRPELALVRRDPDTLPHVIRSRGHTKVVRVLATAVDLLRLPVPLHPAGATYQAASLILQVRFERLPTDDEQHEVRVVVLDASGTEHVLGAVGPLEDEWTRVRVPLSDLAALRAGPPGAQTLRLGGWGLQGLPPRADVRFDALLAEDAALGDADLVIRGGDGTLAGAGRIYAHGYRAFIESDWRYSLQPDLPDPAPLVSPPPGADRPHHVVYVDIWERPVHGFQDPFLVELALGGEETGFRSRKVTQIRVREVAKGASEALASPIGGGRITTNVPTGTFPDRYPAEDPDPCRDRCLFTENLSTGEGYLGQHNVQVRVEVLSTHLARPVIGWSRENASVVARLVANAIAGAHVVHVDPEDAARFEAGDLVMVEDERSRLDPGRDSHRSCLRRVRAVNAGTGELEFEPAGMAAATSPDLLDVGGPLDRAFAVADAAAVRRWDGADWLLTDVRYNLADGITFALDGVDFRVTEYWTFTARVADPDGSAHGVVEQLTHAPVQGPWHERVALGRVEWTDTGRTFTDLRVRFLPLHEVRNRLIELGRRHLSPGAFTVVVGDGVDTFGDIDQDIAEGVTGDEAIQAALSRLRSAGGTIYIRAGRYKLEHPVLVRARNAVRILGDGDATELEVTGAGGAFYLDWCGHDAEVTLELLRLVESPEEQTPIGTGALVRELPVAPLVPGPELRAFAPHDLLVAMPLMPDLLSEFAGRLRFLRPFEGRAAESVVATIASLRRLQRAHPGRPLEEIAPDELNVLRRLPHGVVTIADSSRVRLSHLSVISRETGNGAGVIAAGVLISGSCAHVVVSGCRVEAPSGVVAAPYGRSLTPAALVFRPRSGLFLHGVVLADNDIRARGEASFGVRVADGVLDGIDVHGNRIDGFRWGVALEDRAETRAGEPVDRSVVRDNLVVGSRSVGILVTGDGMDVVANEVRIGAEREPLCAGVQVTGVANRVRDCWISFPAGARSPLGLHAGIVVGSGADRPDLLGRPVQDVEVVGNRIEGGGTMVTGVLIGGSQPTYDVRVVGNTIRNLGDAGVRAWGHAGSIGGLRVEENSIEGVARSYMVWGPQAVAELGTLTRDVAVPPQATPRDALAGLLASATDVTAGLDAVLRWLEHATLRGGVVLSLAEESEVRRNRIVDVGTRTLPPGFVSPGAVIRTAGVAVAGGRDVVVEGNRVQRVQAPVQAIKPQIGPDVLVRPPIFDKLRELGALQRRTTPFGGLHGAAVALRRDLQAYAAGTVRVRQRLGGHIYTAMEAISGTLEQGGPERRRLAVELAGGISRMQESQGLEGHTTAANHVRATLSKVASLAAGDEAVSEAWALAARFDDALLASDEDVATVASDVIANADDLSEGLHGIELDLAAKARNVIAGTGSEQARKRARQDLAHALGTMAEGRAGAVESARAAAGGGLAPADRAVAEGIVRLSLDALSGADAVDLNEDAIAGIEQGAGALAEVLQTAHPVLAERVRQDLRALRSTRGQVAPEHVVHFRETLGAVRGFATGEEAPAIRTKDVEAQGARFRGELVTLTADQLERRVAGLAHDPESAASRNLRLIEQSVGQLVRLVGSDPDLAAKARQARQSLVAAVTDVDHRADLEGEARQLLREIQERQAQKTGAAAPVAPTDATESAPPDAEVRLAALGELLLVLRDTDAAATRAEGIGLFEEEFRRALDTAGITGAERENLLSAVSDAARGIGAGGEARAFALHRLAGVVETVSYRMARSPDAPAEVKAVHVLHGAVVRAIDPRTGENDRLGAIGRLVAGAGTALSASLAVRLGKAATSADALAAARAGLTGLIHLTPLRPPVRPVSRLEAHPADGVYIAGVQRRLELRGNVLEDVRTGGTVVGQADHVLAPAGGEAALSLAVEGNQIAGGAIAGLDLQPDGTAAVALVGNEVTGCAGAGPHPEPERGQAVVRVAGTGDLLVAGNLLRDNGNRRSGGVIHELLFDWRGDVTLRDNFIRHAGGAAGGGGVVVLDGAVTGELVRALSSRPALVVEPPSTPRPPDVGPVVRPDIDDLLAAGLASRADALQSRNVFSAGSLRMATRELRPSIALFDVGGAPPRPVQLAELRADQWLEVPVVARFHPLLAFLHRAPLPLVFFRPQVRRAVHVSGNDVVAAGPALLLLVEGGDLVSATVVGNALESSAATGAVYLRNVDTTVFSSNRCECLGEVNVVVVRARRSLVTVMGNVAAGAEPPAPPRPPVLPFRPDLREIGDVHLAIKVGAEGALTLKLDQEALMSAIAERKGTSFRNLAEDAEVSFNLFATKHKITSEPEVAGILSSAGPSDLLRIGGDVDAPMLEPASGAPGPRMLRRAVATSNQILGDKALSGSAKLFGLAVSSGLASHQARALVQAQLVRTGGDEKAALATGLGAITGLQEVGPTVTERLDAASPVEDIVSLLLRNRHFKAVETIDALRPVPLPPVRPPDPRAHSLVVLGGSRVGALNNVTTAGVLVNDAAQAVENNL